jgi:hypothetical protein
VATPSVCILGGGHYGRFVPYVLEEELSFVPVPVTILWIALMHLAMQYTT